MQLLKEYIVKEIYERFHYLYGGIHTMKFIQDGFTFNSREHHYFCPSKECSYTYYYLYNRAEKYLRNYLSDYFLIEDEVYIRNTYRNHHEFPAVYPHLYNSEDIRFKFRWEE